MWLLVPLSARLTQGIAEGAASADVTVFQNRVGSMMTAFFQAQPVTRYADALRSDTKRFGRFFHAMLERGFYLAPSQFEAAFVSLAHTPDDIDATIAAASRAALMAPALPMAIVPTGIPAGIWTIDNKES